ncbi:hypothetical protein FJT64_021990 [Amphibalanus amphitrite]|uniref:RNase H type-1 domain-containing protein n=1 Tax=Amphibalanus amphitrite TaxID=1232801 RepID=A0A6A4WS38_AMPAM|nr:hypothetical protein FJT64_021990 [Amphibalanus amphitrite]
MVSALYSCDPPWLGHRGGITFRVDLPVATRRSDPPAVCREAALQAIAELPHPDVTIWSDGSARGGRNRAAQALIQFHHLNREETVRAPAGAVCSSLRAELTAMREAFAAVAGLEDGELASTKSVRLLTDSRSGLQLLGRGPANHTMALAAEVWRLLSAEHHRRERHRDGAPVRSNDRFTVNDLQWMPSHSATSAPTRGGGQEAAALPQSTVPVDVGNAHRATIRSARDRAVAD